MTGYGYDVGLLTVLTLFEHHLRNKYNLFIIPLKVKVLIDRSNLPQKLFNAFVENIRNFRSNIRNIIEQNADNGVRQSEPNLSKVLLSNV